MTTLSPHPSPQPTIPAILIGVTRATALDSSITRFAGTPYYVAAVLDLSEAPQEYRHSPQNLGTLLYALHSRPRILVTGTAIDEETVKEIGPVWEEHVNRVEGQTCWVVLSKTHGQPGPPPPGIGDEVMKQLDAVFRPEIRHD